MKSVFLLSGIIFLASAVFAAPPPKPTAEPYKVFRHYNLDDKKYNGRSEYYRKTDAGDTEYSLVLNMNNDNEIFSYEESIFDAEGNFLKGQFEDFREKSLIKMEIKSNRKYEVFFTEKGNPLKKYEGKIGNSVVFPSELYKFVEKKTSGLKPGEEVKVTVFFPNLVHISYLSNNFNFIIKSVTPDNEGEIKIDIYPASYIIQRLLPRRKKKITLIYDLSKKDFTEMYFDNYRYHK